MYGHALTRHFTRVVTLLCNADAGALRQFNNDVPERTLREILPRILQEFDSARLKASLVPLLNAADLQGTLMELLEVMDTSCIIQLLGNVPAHKLAIVLRAPRGNLADLIAAVDAERIPVVLIPVLQEPEDLLAGTLVPLLEQVRNPGRIAAVANLVETDVLLWFLRGVPADRLAPLIDALSPEDFQAGGTAIALLQQLADARGLVRDKVVPLITRGEPTLIAQIIQGTSANNLLEVLRRVEVDGVLLFLENTNIEFVIRVFNGPLDTAVAATVAGSFADSLRNPLVASSLKQLTDGLNDTFQAADQAQQTAVDYAMQNVQRPVLDYVRRGKEQRGASGDEAYEFGDFTRGIVQTLSDKFAQDTQAFADTVKQNFQAVNLGFTRTVGISEEDVEAEVLGPEALNSASEEAETHVGDIEEVEENREDGQTEEEPCRGEDEEQCELVTNSGRVQSSQHTPPRQKAVDGCNVSVNMLGPFKLPTMNAMPKLPEAAEAKAKVDHLKKEVDEMGRRGREALSGALDRGKDAWSASMSAVKDAQQAAVFQGLDCKRSATRHKAAETETESIFG